ncbi:MAG: hypothetical protein J6S56_01480 [Bacteroidales bacterium]|nr:hypothetical protein [Bacteroidales bacterium]
MRSRASGTLVFRRCAHGPTLHVGLLRVCASGTGDDGGCALLEANLMSMVSVHVVAAFPWALLGVSWCDKRPDGALLVTPGDCGTNTSACFRYETGVGPSRCSRRERFSIAPHAMWGGEPCVCPISVPEARAPKPQC